MSNELMIESFSDRDIYGVMLLVHKTLGPAKRKRPLIDK